METTIMENQMENEMETGIIMGAFHWITSLERSVKSTRCGPGFHENTSKPCLPGG